MKKIKAIIGGIADIIMVPLTLIASIWFKFLTRLGYQFFPISDSIFMKIGVLPVRDHYYQPLINPEKHLKQPLSKDRSLPGIDLNEEGQLRLLSEFNYNEELLAIPMDDPTGGNPPAYYYNNRGFESGDAEFLYNIVRHFKPKNIIEIGSGNSTLMALNAINQNKKEDTGYNCELTCVEPYEMKWLEKTSAKVLRKKVEDIEIDFFKKLGANDILFIDSSHIIRPQGDVLYEFLYILPQLNPGVIVHVHDIFTPADYREEWIVKEHRLWNEQYLLEAFLSNNKDFTIIGAVNFLSHKYREQFSGKCPVFKTQQYREPGSFWMQRNYKS